MVNSSTQNTYTFFLNQQSTNGYKGFVGFGIKELDKYEQKLHCSNKTSYLPKFKNNINFTTNFWLRVYTSGCYYIDPTTGKWSSYGVEIQSDSNERYTHCVSSHLTEFAGGWIVLPATIDFEYVWANASFTKNALIYSMCIVVFSLYVLLSIWARRMDIIDAKKIGVVALDDNFADDNYFYEVLVLTGTRKEAGTDSKVI